MLQPSRPLRDLYLVPVVSISLSWFGIFSFISHPLLFPQLPQQSTSWGFCPASRGATVKSCSAWWSISEPAGECAKVTHAFSGIFQDIRTKTEELDTHLLLCGCELLMCLTIYNPQIAELQNHHKLKFMSHNFLFLKFMDIYFHSKASSFHISCFWNKNALQIEIKTDMIYSSLNWCCFFLYKAHAKRSCHRKYCRWYNVTSSVVLIHNPAQKKAENSLPSEV